MPSSNPVSRANHLLAALLIPVSLLLGSPAVAAPAAPAVQDARNWLERMNRSVRELDYEGHFVYSHGEVLETMHIVHLIRDGREQERLVSLNGAAREVIRDDRAVTCKVPSRGRIQVSRRPIGRSFSPLLPIDADDLTQNYLITLGPERRVAGRQSVTVDIRPRDDLRYGYILSLDREHALPLRSVMQDINGQVQSQILFTDLRIGSEVRELEITNLPDEALEGRPHSAALESVRMQQPCCQFAKLPPGFALSMHRHRVIDDQTRAEHFVFSDGLASVSVYVEPYRSGHGLIGASSMGSFQVFGLQLDDYQVTAVGEVPSQTLRWFTDGMSVSER